jgi:hypothetical protein
MLYTVVSSVGWSVSKEIERTWKQTILTYRRLRLPEETEDKQENLNQSGRYSELDSNLAPSE